MSEKKGLFSGLFGGKKKNNCCCNMEIIEEPECEGSCCALENSDIEAAAAPLSAEDKTLIKVVGSGCAKCQKLGENAKAAADELGIDYQIIKVSDMMDIASTGIMQTPGLIINDKIVSKGKVLSASDIKQLLNQ